ncbi:LysR family transcriptional regulator [Aestuariispira insulae]|uniref:LysR family transcriptional regulator n=1 Tax=Aestuariispira insulae TaxID=1461337 RepID=A0A3D9H1G9_9PROT|nr:LysR family transcriptional regulator [Aestuariispira insulae]RED43353.1 LysR family transcriptional regulator [Aestuariispira insulae]
MDSYEPSSRKSPAHLQLELLSFERLRLFVIAARASSFSEVARLCGKTQSTISSAINNMEIDIGAPLFDRNRKGIRLSTTGQALYPAALDILKRLKHFERRALILRDGSPDNLTIHMDAYFPYMELVKAISSIEKQYPDAEIAVRIAAPFTAFRHWSEHVEDLILTCRSLATACIGDVRSIPINKVKFQPVVSCGHPLAGQDRVGKEDLEQHRQIIFDNGRIARPQGASSRRIIAGGLHYQKNLIKRGVGWGYMPIHFVEESVQEGSLVPLQLVDQDYYPELTFRLAWHALEPLTGIKRGLVETLSHQSKVTAGQDE